MTTRAHLLALGLVACAPDPAPPTAALVPGGVEVRADVPLQRVILRDQDGHDLATRRLPVPTTEVVVPLRWAPGQPLMAEAHAGDQVWTVQVDVPASRAAAELLLEVPLGQGSARLSDGDRVPLLLIEGGTAQIGLVVTAHEAVSISATVDGATRAARLAVPGERAVLTWEIGGAEPVPVEVETCAASGAPCAETRATLLPESLPPGAARARLAVVETVFPTDPIGGVDPSRSPDRVHLPAAWWRTVLQRLELGYRPADSHAPWAWQAVRLENRGQQPQTVVVRARVLDAQGQPDPAFRPRLRETDDGTGNVTVLLRVPPGQTATAALPVFVDEATVADGLYTRHIEVIPLGAAAPLHTLEVPLVVRRGSSALSGAFLFASLASLTGLGMTLRFTKRWLAASPTSDLMRISLFGSLMFVVAAVSQLLAMGVSALLGPFSALLTGLVDDALRTTLFATLLCLLPRPGVATLTLATSYLLRALALGNMGPVELLFFGGHALWLELCLWISGITRLSGWRDEGPGSRWLRLVVAFAFSSAINAVNGLVHSAVLYRLFYADWYVALLVALPGFLYPTLAAALASRFADSLRRVEA